MSCTSPEIIQAPLWCSSQVGFETTAPAHALWPSGPGGRGYQLGSALLVHVRIPPDDGGVCWQLPAGAVWQGFLAAGTSVRSMGSEELEPISNARVQVM